MNSLIYFQGIIVGGEEDQQVQQMDLLQGQIGILIIDQLRTVGSLLAAGSRLVAWEG